MSPLHLDEEPGICRSVARFLFNSGYPFDWTTPGNYPPKDVVAFLIKYWIEDAADDGEMMTWEGGRKWVKDAMRGQE